MTLPLELSDALNTASDALGQQTQNDVRLGYRQLVWSKLGARLTKLPATGGDVGYRRRLALATSCVEKVAHVWNERLGDDDAVRQALQMAQHIGNGDATASDGWSLRDELWSHCDDLANDHEDLQLVIAVGYGAVQTLATALEDERFDVEDIDLDLTDQDVDAEEMDASFFAASAQADGPIWEPESAPVKRLAFWRWWLDEAVPAAWMSHT